MEFPIKNVENNKITVTTVKLKALTSLILNRGILINTKTIPTTPTTSKAQIPNICQKFIYTLNIRETLVKSSKSLTLNGVTLKLCIMQSVIPKPIHINDINENKATLKGKNIDIESVRSIISAENINAYGEMKRNLSASQTDLLQSDSTTNSRIMEKIT